MFRNKHSSDYVTSVPGDIIFQLKLMEFLNVSHNQIKIFTYRSGV